MILFSFGVYYGWREFFIEKFFVGPKKGYAYGFCAALVACIYFSLIDESLMTIVALLAEVGCMLYYLASYFPGGTDGITTMLKGAWSMLTSCCKRQVDKL